MEKRFYIIAITLSAVSIATAYGTVDRRLSMETGIVDVKSNRWDFEGPLETDACPFYRMYGDSLIAEFWNGGRQWYAVRGDSVFYLGEETRYHKTLTQNPIPTAALGNMWLTGRDTTRTDGHYFHTYSLTQDGIYECTPPIKGEMIIGDDQTVPAVAVTESRKYTSYIWADSLHSTALISKEIHRTRWFIGDDPLPVAMQATIKEFSHGKEISSESKTFLIPMDDLLSMEETQIGKLQQALDNAEIIYNNGIIKIMADFPQSVRLQLYLSNIQGSVSYQDVLDVIPHSEDVIFRLPSFPPGAYLITLSAGTPTDKKFLINI